MLVLKQLLSILESPNHFNVVVLVCLFQIARLFYFLVSSVLSSNFFPKDFTGSLYTGAYSPDSVHLNLNDLFGRGILNH